MVPEFVVTQSRVMTKEESDNVLGIMVIANSRPEVYIEDSSEKDSFPFQVMIKRLKYLELPFRITEAFLMLSLATFVKSPGGMVMLIRLCYQRWLKHRTMVFNVVEWVNMFPNGVPTDEVLEGWWKSQKIPYEKQTGLGDNAIDLKEEWPLVDIGSLQPKAGL